jgi:hypothetical protein
MKKLLFVLSLVCFLSACDKTAKIEKAAQDQCNKFFMEIAKDPESVKNLGERLDPMETT